MYAAQYCLHNSKRSPIHVVYLFTPVTQSASTATYLLSQHSIPYEIILSEILHKIFINRIINVNLYSTSYKACEIFSKKQKEE